MDHRALTRAIAKLTHAAVLDGSGQSMLRELSDAAARALPADGVGVMSTDVGGNRFVHASSPGAAQLERLQESSRTGPCRDAAASGVLVLASHATADAAWPEFASAAINAGIHAMAAVPLMSRGRCWGVLDLYRGPDELWNREELEAAETLAGVATAHLVMAADREAFRLVVADLARQDTHDHLTGLANRTLLEDRLQHALQTAPARDRRVGVLYVNLSDFRQVNNTHGHAAGDQVLREVAQRLRSATGKNDTVGRLAGDEFVIICEDLPPESPTTSLRALDAMAGSIRASLTTAVEIDGRAVVVQARIAVTLADGSSAIRELVRETDHTVDQDTHMAQDLPSPS